MGKIADTIYEELNYMYCDNCRHSGEMDEDGYSSHCDGCYRKYSNWAVSKETAECIEKLCKGYINNLEKQSYIEGYKAGCGEGKKCYERPLSFWVKEENESYYFDRQTGDLVVGVRYHCFKCSGSGDNKDKFCKHCGAEMKGGTEEC